MAGTVADYIVLLDDPIDILINAHEDFEFNIPSSAFVGPDVEGRTQDPILMLMVNYTGAAINDLKANASINDKNVWNYGPTDTELTRPFHEVVPAKLLKTGKNKLTVKVESGQGKLRVSDIVVWFQNKV
jgi:hypothetical protein